MDLAFRLYRCDGRWRWRLTGRDGPIAVSKRGYATKRGAMKALQRFRSLPFAELPCDAGRGSFHSATRRPIELMVARYPGSCSVLHDEGTVTP